MIINLFHSKSFFLLNNFVRPKDSLITDGEKFTIKPR